MTPDEYELVWDNIAAKIEDGGYWVGKEKPGLRSSGLDRSKRSPTSLFYAPAQARNPTDSFFDDYNGPDRASLNPSLWIKNNVVPFSVPVIWEKRSAKEIDTAAVEEATRRWGQSKQQPEQGNARFFQYARDLQTAGMSLSEIESKLRIEAKHGRSEQERSAQIPSIMSSLGGWLGRVTPSPSQLPITFVGRDALI